LEEGRGALGPSGHRGQPCKDRGVCDRHRRDRNRCGGRPGEGNSIDLRKLRGEGMWMTSVSTGTMSESDTKESSKEAAALVRAFYESLARGRMVDALDLVATDAVLRDEAGNESRGIGAIA